MRMVNGLCRYRELATVIEASSFAATAARR
jgi:hypothetical protein